MSRIPQCLVNAFDENASTRADAGRWSGCNGDAKEAIYFKSYLTALQPKVDPHAMRLARPISDDFIHYLDPYYDNINAGIIQRYKRYNRMEGNVQSKPKYNGRIPICNQFTQYGGY